MIRQHHTRSGFSLIELLVVISLLSILAALSAGAYFRIRTSQVVSATEATMKKLDTGLERIWSAERDRAEKEFNEQKLPYGNTMPALLNFCGGANEKDRARAVWMTARMKSEFPQTFQEAWTAVKIVDPSTSIVALNLPTKSTFTSKVQNIAAANANDANNMAAALLYIILNEKGSRGEIFADDGIRTLTKTVQIPDGTGPAYTVYTDAFSSPITYVRQYNSAELDNKPFARYAAGTVANNTSQDPLDPLDKLRQSRWNTTQGNTARTQLGYLSNYTNTMNWIPTVVSPGVNRLWDSLDVRYNGATLMPNNNIGIVYETPSPNNDNLYGYRLRQMGARSD